MTNIFAVTEQCTAPAYLSLNERSGTTVLTVRSRGEAGVTMPVSAIVLTDEEMAQMAVAMAAHLRAKGAMVVVQKGAAVGKSTVNQGAACASN